MQQLALNKAMTELDALHVRVDLMRKELVKKLVYLQPGLKAMFERQVSFFFTKY